jgi:acetyl-CoA carboxylase biotin carboxylase subunit
MAAKAVHYVGAGTIEFLVDKNVNSFFRDEYSFAVEHPITEEVLGIDLVKEQIKIAEGQVLALKQEDIKQRGHAIELRICAEDAEMDFMPSPGIIKKIIEPNGIGVRIDSYVYEGYEIPAYYDPMISKLIVWAVERQYAIQRLQRVLHEYKITGIKTNINYLNSIIAIPDFVEGKYDTGFIAKHNAELKETEYNENLENLALMVSYIDYIVNLDENAVENKNDNRPLNRWRSFGLHKGVLRV